MAWRFKVSKYKNATPNLPKKEDWVSGIKVGAPTSCGNHIKASAAFVAFNVENRGGGSLCVVPLDYKGRMETSAPLIHGHSDLITDFNFSPFDDGMLATCSTDANVRIWHIPEGGLTENCSEPEYSLPQFDKRVENVNFHPTADFLLTVGYFDTIKLWDLKKEKEVYCFNHHEDQVQSTSWRANGTLLVSTAKDKMIRVIDPRSKTVAYQGESHKTSKDSRVVWLGDTDHILSTGFDAFRSREVRIRDLRNFTKPYKVQTFDSSTGILMPLFDADTNMLFLAGKADVSIMYWELSEKEPYLMEGLKHSESMQTKGACLVPKRGLNVMSGEVNRVLQLTSSAVIPITYQVPRKTYREFHADIFPETSSAEPSMSVGQWLQGSNICVKKMSLDPSKQHTSLQVHRGPLGKREGHDIEVDTPVPAPRSYISKDTQINNNDKPTVAVKEDTPTDNSQNQNEANGNRIDNTTVRKNFESRSVSLDDRKKPSAEDTAQRGSNAAELRRAFIERLSMDAKPVSPIPRRAAGPTRSFRRVCKFRHLKGTPAHKSSHIDNLRDLNRTIPGECNGIAANAEFVILPLSGQSGKLSVIRHQQGGRLPDGVIPSFLNGTGVLDFAFDPFNDNCLAAACDDGKIRLWNIPDGGLQQPTNEPFDTMSDSAEKLTIVKWHPLANGILATACGDLSIKIWDNARRDVSLLLEGHNDQIFSMAWSPCGRMLATVCRDGSIRIFDARKSLSPTHKGAGPPGVRGARILWVLDGRFIIVCGFSKISERQVSIFKWNDLSKALNTVTIDVNPAILVPSYDCDSSTLFITGKGDSTIYAYEVGEDSPHLFPLSHHKGASVHQGFVLLPKRMCDVRAVEFAKALRLTQATLEPLSFTVPRVKTELFQDDLFPPTQVTWEPVMTSAEWFGGTNRPSRLVSLQPPDMQSLSESRDSSSPSSTSAPTPAPPQAHVRKTTPPFLKGLIPSEVKQTQRRLEESMSQQLGPLITSLEQDQMEGVDTNEWDDWCSSQTTQD